MTPRPTIRALSATDIDAYLAHGQRHVAISGVAPELPYGPNLGVWSQPLRLRVKLLQAWGRPPDHPRWRRSWGAITADGRVVASVSLKGGAMTSSLHRTELAIGVERPYRRRGLAHALTEAALSWARSQPALAWVDLNVFAGNDAALALYRGFGFSETGRTTDQFRIGGRSLDNHSMTLSLPE